MLKNSEKLSIPSGVLSVLIKNKEGKLIEEKILGKNLIVNNAKLIMSHLIGQDVTLTGSNALDGIAGFNPTTSGLNGGISITPDILNANANTPDKFRPVYFGFGTGTTGTSVTDAGLENLIGKDGTDPSGTTPTTAEDYFYGGPSGSTNPAVIEYLPSAGTPAIDHATVKISVNMPTTQGQSTGSSIAYTEFGLFTDFIAPDNSVKFPLMFARKTFAPITKTQDVSLVFVWAIRF